jgi:hypothetical protein
MKGQEPNATVMMRRKRRQVLGSIDVTASAG